MSFTQFFLSSREGGEGFVTWKLNMQVCKSSDGRHWGRKSGRSVRFRRKQKGIVKRDENGHLFSSLFFVIENESIYIYLFLDRSNSKNVGGNKIGIQIGMLNGMERSPRLILVKGRKLEEPIMYRA